MASLCPITVGQQDIGDDFLHGYFAASIITKTNNQQEQDSMYTYFFNPFFSFLGAWKFGEIRWFPS